MLKETYFRLETEPLLYYKDYLLYPYSFNALLQAIREGRSFTRIARFLDALLANPSFSIIRIPGNLPATAPIAPDPGRHIPGVQARNRRLQRHLHANDRQLDRPNRPNGPQSGQRQPGQRMQQRATHHRFWPTCASSKATSRRN